MAEEKWNIKVLSVGERSLLKRNAGLVMGYDIRAIEAYYRAVVKPPKVREREEKLFACLCMECLWKEEDYLKELPLEELLKKLYQSDNSSESMKTRIINMLDIPWGDDGFLIGKIYGLIRKIKTQGVAVKPDFNKLYDDLCQWNSPDQYIQRRWIRTICAFDKEEE